MRDKQGGGGEGVFWKPGNGLYITEVSVSYLKVVHKMVVGLSTIKTRWMFAAL